MGLRGPKPIPIQDRIFLYVDAMGDCWAWTGPRNKAGYGYITVQRASRLAHRVVWELLVGPILKGLVADHLCRNHVCVNPDHLEMVTRKVNNLRGATLAYFNG